MTVTDEYLANNDAYAATFSGPLPLPPSKHVAVVACMDARLDVYRALGIGEALEQHDAGGLAGDETVGGRVEGVALTGRREHALRGSRRQLAGLQDEIHATGEHQVAAPDICLVPIQADPPIIAGRIVLRQDTADEIRREESDQQHPHRAGAGCPSGRGRRPQRKGQ